MLQIEETIDQLKVLVKEAGSNPNQEQLVKNHVPASELPTRHAVRVARA